MRASLKGLALAIAGILLAGVLDWASGVELRVYPLYFLPLSLGSWHGGRRGAVALAILAAATWGASNAAAGLEFTHESIWIYDVAMQWVGFATVGFLIAELTRSRPRRARPRARDAFVRPRRLIVDRLLPWTRHSSSLGG